jgi:hypothetical protein
MEIAIPPLLTFIRLRPGIEWVQPMSARAVSQIASTFFFSAFFGIY